MHITLKHAASVVVLVSITTVCSIALATAQSQLPFAYPKAGQPLEAERSRIASAQIAQDTAKQSAQSGAIDLASANKEFANPLTAATMVIMENDTVLLGGDLSDGTKVTNITVFEPIIPVPLGNGWGLVNRPILPFAVSAPIPVAGSGGGAAEGGTFSFDDHSGLGDFTFFSLLAPPTLALMFPPLFGK